MATLLALLLLATEALCSTVLISVELPTIESKKAWHQLKIPTYELIGNTAITEIEESQVGSLKQKGYLIEIIDRQPETSKCMVISKNEKAQGPKEKPIWQNGQAAIIKPLSKGHDLDLEYKHITRPMNIKPLGDRFWKSVTTKYVTLKSVPYDPFIQSLVDQVNADSITSYIQRLQDFRTRFSLTDSSTAASQWLVDKLTGWGYVAEYDSFYLEIWHHYIDTSYFIDSGYTRNVIASKIGLMDPNSISIISGHYDSYSEYDELISQVTSPGADDNASGTAGAMEVSRVLSGTNLRKTIMFCGWAAEEQGILGSKHYATYADSACMNVANMFNMDMVGFKSDTIIDGKLSSPKGWLRDLALQVIPSYVSDYQYLCESFTGCDDWSFAELGFPTLAFEEPALNPNIHRLTDSLKTLSADIYTKNTKAAVALMAIISQYPNPVEPFVADIGNGSSLQLIWEPSQESDIEGYYVYWGKTSGIYSDSSYILGKDASLDTINGLISDTTYYIIMRAVASDGTCSYAAVEKSGTPKAFPLAPSGLTPVPVDSGVSLDWSKNLELDLAGYDVYRRVDGSLFESLASTTDTFLLDKPLSGASRYFYKVQAKDSDGNKSPLSDSVYCRPITLDQGIIMVDETNNWTTGSFPRDAQQDSLYNYIMTGYDYEPYEYGLSSQRPILGDFGPYSTVVWFADDYAGLLAPGAVADMKAYLAAGGKLWFAGWKPSSNIHNTTTYPANYSAGDIAYDHFKISQAELSGTTDSFRMAAGLRGYPDIMVDTLKYPSTIWGKTFRSIEALTPLTGADTIYVMDMKNNGSTFEGKACAVRDSGKTVFFGFPLYFMDKEQAKLAAQKVMAEFGEVPLGVVGKPDNRERITDFRLFQNSPNPFKNQTAISYQLPQTGRVKLNIYNIAGQLVKTLVNGEQQAGSYTVKWNRLDSKNRQVSAGVYIYHLSTDGKTQSRKMIVLK
ncbi:M28 family peptidase [candidate division TA06 bacterium]|nr:M28 family peptidase [candidate division TA06 bacterium]